MTSSVSVTHILDLDSVLDRVGGDVDLLREIAGMFLEEYPVLLVEIAAAVHLKDPVRLERAAHSLKGAVSNFGAKTPTDAAFSLETIGRQNRMTDAAEALLHLEAEFRQLDPVLREIADGKF